MNWTCEVRGINFACNVEVPDSNNVKKNLKPFKYCEYNFRNCRIQAKYRLGWRSGTVKC